MIYMQQWWSLYFFTSCSSPTRAGGSLPWGTHKRVARFGALHPLPRLFIFHTSPFSHSIRGQRHVCPWKVFEGVWLVPCLPHWWGQCQPHSRFRTQSAFSHAPTEHNQCLPWKKKKRQSDRRRQRSAKSPSPVWSLCVWASIRVHGLGHIRSLSVWIGALPTLLTLRCVKEVGSQLNYLRWMM